MSYLLFLVIAHGCLHHLIRPTIDLWLCMNPYRIPKQIWTFGVVFARTIQGAYNIK